MVFPYPPDWPQYVTASIRNGLPVLATDKYKNIVADSLHLMVKDNRIELNAFVVMDIIFIWTVLQKMEWNIWEAKKYYWKRKRFS